MVGGNTLKLILILILLNSLHFVRLCELNKEQHKEQTWKRKERYTKRQHDIETERARGTQNIIFGSLSKPPRQSLSLPSNCERRATPSGIVEHNLAAAALQDKPGLLHWARSGLLALSVLLPMQLYCLKNVISRWSVFTVFIIWGLICVKWQLPFFSSSSTLSRHQCLRLKIHFNAFHTLKFSLLLFNCRKTLHRACVGFPIRHTAWQLSNTPAHNYKTAFFQLCLFNHHLIIVTFESAHQWLIDHGTLVFI